MPSINSALNGLAAASQRLNVSAGNTANQNSTASNVNGDLVNKPFQAQKVQEVSLADGGVQSVVLPVDPASIPRFDPASAQADEAGVVQYPNVSEDNEATQRIIASRAFQANLESIATADENLATLLDITG